MNELHRPSLCTTEKHDG